MTKGVKELLKLIDQYPDFPVLFAVGYEVVADDSFNYWIGHTTGASVDKICFSRFDNFSENGFVSYDDDDVEDTLASVLPADEYEALPDDDEGRRKAFEALPWKDCIVVFVEAGDDD